MAHLFDDFEEFQEKERISDDEKLQKYSQGGASPIYTPRMGGQIAFSLVSTMQSINA